MDITISDDGYLAMLIAQNGGAVIEELDRELIKGVGAIFDHGGKSEISIKIALSRVKNMDSAVDVSHNVIANHPKEKRPSRAMFITEGNGLSDHFQKQESLGLELETTVIGGRLGEGSEKNISQIKPK